MYPNGSESNDDKTHSSTGRRVSNIGKWGEVIMARLNKDYEVKPGDKVAYFIEGYANPNVTGAGIVASIDFKKETHRVMEDGDYEYTNESFFVICTDGDFEFEADSHLPYPHVLVVPSMGDVVIVIEDGSNPPC